MEKLKKYLKGLPNVAAREQFAARVGTTLGYLRVAMSLKKQFGAPLCIAIEDESDGAVTVDDLMPAVDWDGYIDRRIRRQRIAKAMEASR